MSKLDCPVVGLLGVEVVRPWVRFDKVRSCLLDSMVDSLEIGIDRFQRYWTLEEGGLIKVALVLSLQLRQSLSLALEIPIDLRLLIRHATLNNDRVMHQNFADRAQKMLRDAQILQIEGSLRVTDVLDLGEELSACAGVRLRRDFEDGLEFLQGARLLL